MAKMSDEQIMAMLAGKKAAPAATTPAASTKPVIAGTPPPVAEGLMGAPPAAATTTAAPPAPAPAATATPDATTAPPVAPPASTPEPATAAPPVVVPPVIVPPAAAETPAAPASLADLLESVPSTDTGTPATPPRPTPSSSNEPDTITKLKYAFYGLIGGLALGLVVGNCSMKPKQAECKKPVAAQVDASVPVRVAVPAPASVPAARPVIASMPPAGINAGRPNKPDNTPELCGNGVIDTDKEEQCDSKSRKPNKGCAEDKKCNAKCKCVPKLAGGNEPTTVSCKGKADMINAPGDKQPYRSMLRAVHEGVMNLKGSLGAAGISTVTVTVKVCPPGNKAGSAKIFSVQGAGKFKQEVIRSVGALLRGTKASEEITKPKQFTEEVNL